MTRPCGLKSAPHTLSMFLAGWNVTSFHSEVDSRRRGCELELRIRRVLEFSVDGSSRPAPGSHWLLSLRDMCYVVTGAANLACAQLHSRETRFSAFTIASRSERFRDDNRMRG
jgi:hypothetical protein